MISAIRWRRPHNRGSIRSRQLLASLLGASVLVLNASSTSVSAPMAQAQCTPGQGGFVAVPDTISVEWQERLRRLPDPSCRPAFPAPDDVEGWKALQTALEAARMPASNAALARYGPTIAPGSIGGVPVLDIKPRDWRDDGKVLVYAHGGGYTFYSSQSTLNSTAPVADATGLRVIAVDYTLAPVGKWDLVTDQFAAVIQGLEAEGYRPQDIGAYGDSAGGALAASATLKLRDRGRSMPAAIVMWSPGADVTDRGDTHLTLKHADPTVVYLNYSKNGFAAYADVADQKNPYVSPVYGDFSRGFPPTLIQGGTKEVLLSSFVRLYRALDSAGVPVILDLYEGMPHVFQQILPESPESRLAVGKMRSFLNAQLGR